eukprot:6194077-Pleurochrysis_carterae.AAC.1
MNACAFRACALYGAQPRRPSSLTATCPVSAPGSTTREDVEGHSRDARRRCRSRLRAQSRAIDESGWPRSPGAADGRAR